MKHLFLAVFFCGSFALAEEPLSNFDGSTQILGLMDEPIPNEWFSESFEEIYSDENHFFGRIFPSSSATQLSVFIANESSANNAVIISTVSSATGLSKNYLVQIPEGGSKTLDVSTFNQSAVVYFVSLLPFKAFFDVGIDQGNGTLSEEVDVTPASTTHDIGSLAYNCSANNCEGNLRVTNANGPAVGGYNVGFFRVGTLDRGGFPPRVEPSLNVYYPDSRKLFHKHKVYQTCNGTRPVSDTYDTVGVTSHNWIRWRFVSASCKTGFQATATCKNCYVTYPDGTREFAVWYETWPDVVPTGL